MSAWGHTRDEAFRRISRAVERTSLVLQPGTTNRSSLLALLARGELTEGPVTRGWYAELAASGALVPMTAAAVFGTGVRGAAVTVATLVGLLLLGGLGAQLGGASLTRGSLRVGVGGALALALTYGIGVLVGTAV